MVQTKNPKPKMLKLSTDITSISSKLKFAKRFNKLYLLHLKNFYEINYFESDIKLTYLQGFKNKNNTFSINKF